MLLPSFRVFSLPPPFFASRLGFETSIDFLNTRGTSSGSRSILSEISTVSLKETDLSKAPSPPPPPDSSLPHVLRPFRKFWLPISSHFHRLFSEFFPIPPIELGGPAMVVENFIYPLPFFCISLLNCSTSLSVLAERPDASTPFSARIPRSQGVFPI